MTSCIKRILAETIKPKDTLAILKYLDALFENLAQKLPNDNDIQNASEFLHGPHTVKAKSRMTAYSTEVNEEG